MRRRDQAEQRKLRIAGRLDGGEHDREYVLRAAGHHGVDRDLLDGRFAVVGRHERDEVLRVAARRLEHRHHPLWGWRDQRQSVGESTIEHRLERILELAYLELAGL